MSDPDEPVETIRWGDLPARPCPVAAALDVFGDRWSLLVVRDILNGVRRFDDLVYRLGISRATLTDRLRRLTEAGILASSDYEDRRGRIRREYRLSPRGWDMQLIFVALREWGDRHGLEPDEQLLRLVNQATGNDVRLALIDTVTGDVVPGRQVSHAPGPAFDRIRSQRSSER